MAFLTAENKNRQLEDLPLTDFGRVPGKEKVFNCELCELKVIPFLTRELRACARASYRYDVGNGIRSLARSLARSIGRFL